MRIKQELIDEVMDNFDFGRVVKAMKAMDWEWFNGNGMSVPDEARARTCVRDLIKTLQEDKECNFTATGGFNVSYKEGELNVKFVLDEYSAYEA